MRYEVFFEKLYVDQGLPWFIQEKDSENRLVGEYKASEVFFKGRARTVFLPKNDGGKRGYVLAIGTLSWKGTVATLE